MRVFLWALGAAGAILTSGCQTYEFHIVQPAQYAATIPKEPLVFHMDPLDYRFTRDSDHLMVGIINPTTNRISLRGEQSYVVDPKGESHPLRGTVLGPHSYTRLILPPIPATAQVVGPYGYGYGWGWGPGYYGYYGPYWGGPYYDPFFYGPAVTYYEMRTPYDWYWHTGLVRLHLTYDQNGKAFQHDFEFDRQPVKTTPAPPPPKNLP